MVSLDFYPPYQLSSSRLPSRTVDTGATQPAGTALCCVTDTYSSNTAFQSALLLTLRNFIASMGSKSTFFFSSITLISSFALQVDSGQTNETHDFPSIRPFPNIRRRFFFFKNSQLSFGHRNVWYAFLELSKIHTPIAVFVIRRLRENIQERSFPGLLFRPANI